ncbi:hypothetical protein D3C76_1495690 [compost metagenome]
MRLGFIQPILQLRQYRHTSSLPGYQALGIATGLAVTLHTVQFADQVQRHVGPPGFTFRLDFLCLDKFAARMRPTTQPGYFWLCRDSVVARVVIGHQIAAIAVEQA